MDAGDIRIRKSVLPQTRLCMRNFPAAADAAYIRSGRRQYLSEQFIIRFVPRCHDDHIIFFVQPYLFLYLVKAAADHLRSLRITLRNSKLFPIVIDRYREIQHPGVYAAPDL